jgi:hypothetical protein
MTTPYKHLPQAARDLYDSFIRLDSDSYGNPRYYIPGFLLTGEQVKRANWSNIAAKSMGRDMSRKLTAWSRFVSY